MRVKDTCKGKKLYQTLGMLNQTLRILVHETINVLTLPGFDHALFGSEHALFGSEYALFGSDYALLSSCMLFLK